VGHIPRELLENKEDGDRFLCLACLSEFWKEEGRSTWEPLDRKGRGRLVGLSSAVRKRRKVVRGGGSGEFPISLSSRLCLSATLGK